MQQQKKEDAEKKAKKSLKETFRGWGLFDVFSITSGR